MGCLNIKIRWQISLQLLQIGDKRFQEEEL